MRWLLLLALAACAEPDAGTLVFANLDDATIQRVVDASATGEVSGTIFTITNINHMSTCPRVEIDGPTVTLTGGCTAGAATYEGVARITNHWGSEDGAEARYELQEFAITEYGKRTVYNGVAHGYAGPHARLDADFFVERSGQLLRSTLRKRCDGEECSVEGVLELDGGYANVNGHWALDWAWDADITLRGADRVDVAHEVMYGHYDCLLWRLAGTERHGGWCER